MASYHQTKRTQQLMGGHICSKCKSVILTNFVLEAIANSRWTQKKAQEGAMAAAQNALQALVSFPEKPFLVTCDYENRTYSLVSGFILHGLNHVCPYCGNRERWQLSPACAPACQQDSQTGVYLVTDVPEESRLTVFTASEAQIGWQIQTLQAFRQKYRNYWTEHPDQMVAIREQLQNMESRIESLTHQKDLCREKSKWLMSQIQSKEQAMKGYSLFSSERKQCKAELTELKKQHNAQSAREAEQEKSIISDIAYLRQQIQELKVTNPGVLDTVETATPGNAPHCKAARFC